MSQPRFIWDEFYADHIPAEGMDELWARGWRHFGTQFYRYSVMEHEGALQVVVPLRVELAHGSLTRSQRRVLRRNADVLLDVGPAQLTEEVRSMFNRHKTRFTENVPEHLEVFLSHRPATLPCECLQMRCLLDGECIAVSFFDVGATGVSSVYAVFEPAFEARSLGIFTMLKEMEWAQLRGKRFAYPGYASLGRSHYDYKKQFIGLQGYDWIREEWLPWLAMTEGRQPSQNTAAHAAF